MTSRTNWADLKTTRGSQDEMNKLSRFPQVDDFRKALYVVIDRMKRYCVDYLYSIK